MGGVEAVIAGPQRGSRRARASVAWLQARMSVRIDSRIWLVVPAAALLLVVFVYPVFWLLLRSFSDPVWGLQNFRILIDQPVYLRALSNTVMVSGTVTALCLILGYPLAYTIANGGPRLRRLLVFAVLIPFWTSLLVRTFAWMVLLQQRA